MRLLPFIRPGMVRSKMITTYISVRQFQVLDLFGTLWNLDSDRVPREVHILKIDQGPSMPRSINATVRQIPSSLTFSLSSNPLWTLYLWLRHRLYFVREIITYREKKCFFFDSLWFLKHVKWLYQVLYFVREIITYREKKWFLLIPFDSWNTSNDCTKCCHVMWWGKLMSTANTVKRYLMRRKNENW